VIYRKHFGLLDFVYSQVFTGAIPFGNATSAVAIMDIMQGKRPPRPTYPTFTEDLWKLMQRCWDPEPHLRPEVSEALQILLTPLVSHSSQQSFIC